MKVLISDKVSPEGIAYLQEQEGIEVVNRPGLSPQELLAEIRDAQGLIVRSKTKVTPEVIAAAGELRCIGRAGSGVDNIDLEAATRRGVVVMNTPGGNSVSVAEHTFALMLALARNIPKAHSSLAEGEWLKSQLTGSELQGKTLGVVGLGKIGSLVVRRGIGFGMNVLAFDPFISQQFAQDLGVELCELDDVFRRSDYISLHLPANERTKGLICQRSLGLMKQSAILVNAARGTLVDEADLAEALDQGVIAGAGLDVFQGEPDIDPRLRSCQRVVLTPHIAGSTLEAQAKVGYEIAVQLCDYLKREIIRNAVNFPSVSAQDLERLSPYLRLGERLGTLLGRINRIRFNEIAVRYYGDLADLDTKQVTSRIVRSVLKPSLADEVNDVNARARAQERGIEVVETASSRKRSHSNLISVQLRNGQETEWIEGAILFHGNLHLVSVDEIPIEARLGHRLLFIRNLDRPGVIGQVGTILGEAGINIASFDLGRSQSSEYAVGVLNVDSSIPQEVVDRILGIAAVQFAQVTEFE